MDGIELKMPDISNYDLSKPGEMALYNTHIDYYTIKELIETTHNSIKEMQRVYAKEIMVAEAFEDNCTLSKMSMSQTIHSSKVTPMAYNSLLLIMISTLEESFNYLCRMYHIKNKYSIEYTDLYGSGIDRAITYLDKVVDIKGIKQIESWEFVKTARDARNMIVHNGGRIKKDNKSNYEKYGFYIREEDNMLLFDYDIIDEIYNKVLDFTNATFKMEPTF